MISATEFRAKLYYFLDQVLETGEALEVKRHGQILKVVLEKPKPKKGKLAKLKKREGVFSCDPDELVHHDWLSEWSENKR